MRDFKLEAAEMTYDAEASEELRQEVIKRRDAALRLKLADTCIAASRTSTDGAER